MTEFNQKHISHILDMLKKNHLDTTQKEELIRELCQHPLLEEKHLMKNPDLEWDVELLSRNPHIKPCWVQALPDKPWNFQEISKVIFVETEAKKKSLYEHLILTTDDFKYSHLNVRHLWLQLFSTADWNYNYIYQYTDFTFAMLEEIPTSKHDYSLLSMCPNLDLTWLETYPEAPWDFILISFHRNINVKWIERFPHSNWKFNFINWIKGQDEMSQKDKDYYLKFNEVFKIYYFYQNRFDIEWVDKFPHLDWSFEYISTIRKLKLSSVGKYRDENWDFSALSDNINLNARFLKKYESRPWNFAILSRNYYFKIEWLRELPESPWDFKALSEQQQFEGSWVIEFPHCSWDLLKVLKLKNKQGFLQAIVLYQFHHPEFNLFKYLDDLWVDSLTTQYDLQLIYDKIKAPKVISTLYLLFPNIFTTRENPLSLVPQDIKEYPKLSEVEKKNLLRFMDKKINYLPPIPNMFMYPEYDLCITEFSGDISYLPGWFESDNIMGDFYREFKYFADIDGIDLLVDCEMYDVCVYGSKTNNKQFKEKICRTKEGPAVILIYPEDSDDNVEHDCGKDHHLELDYLWELAT